MGKYYQVSSYRQAWQLFKGQLWLLMWLYKLMFLSMKLHRLLVQSH